MPTSKIFKILEIKLRQSRSKKKHKINKCFMFRIFFFDSNVKSMLVDNIIHNRI